MSPRPTTYTYRPGITQDMLDAIADVEAATTAPTPSTLVERTASGYLRDRADSSEIVFPGYRRLAAELGYTALDALYRCQEPLYVSFGALVTPSGLISAGNASEPTLAVSNIPTGGRMAGGFRGIWSDAAGDAFGYQQDVLDVGANSVHLAVAFDRVADTGAVQSLCGRYAAERALALEIAAATDRAVVRINDGTRSATPDVSATAIAVGGIYLLQAHLRKDDGTLKTRLSRWGVGLVSAEVSTDVSAYTTLSGGTTPGFGVAAGVGWGNGINYLGVMVRIGAECNAAGKMAALAQITGFEA